MVAWGDKLGKEKKVIGPDGKPLDRAAILGAIATYNSESRGAKAFAAIPRALVTILDGLASGKTTYVRGKDGQVQVMRGKDGKIAAK